MDPTTHGCCRQCGSPFTPRRPGQQYCRPECWHARMRLTRKRPGPRKRDPRSTTERGYGADHQRLRRQWAPLVATGTVRCARCGELIHPRAAWDLGHDDHDRRRYRGPEHARCNRSAGARKGNRSPLRRRRSSTRTTPPGVTRLRW